MADDGIKFGGDSGDNFLAEWQPSRHECQCAATLWRRSQNNRITMSTYVRTIMDLMLAGFCLLFIITPAIGQEFVVTERTEFVVTDRVASKPVKATPAVKESGRFLAKFTIDGCQPCVNWDRKERSKIDAAGFFVREYNLSDPDLAAKYGDESRGDRQVQRFPTFAICDLADGEWVGEKIVGYASATELLPKLRGKTPSKQVATAKESAVVQFSIYSGKAGSSHQSRASLIDHLLNEGIHLGRHTRAQLDAMTDSELNYLHESDHGWSHSEPQPVVRIQQSGCPGGNCPTPTNRAQRRGGFLRGLFR